MAPPSPGADDPTPTGPLPDPSTSLFTDPSAGPQEVTPPSAPGRRRAAGHCHYPGCSRPVAPAPAVGRPPKYCDDPDHTRITAHRLRRRLDATAAATASATAEASPDTPSPDTPSVGERAAPASTVSVLTSARLAAEAEQRADRRLTRVLDELAATRRAIAALHTELGRLRAQDHPDAQPDAG